LDCIKRESKILRKLLSVLIIPILFLVVLSNCNGETKNETKQKNEDMVSDMQKITFEKITGDTTSLADYKGKVVLLVNVASKCGYTKQYAGLEELYKTYKDSGLVVLGFPANNFGGQEPGTNEEILNFCTTKFDVTFPMMSKISVKGENKHPVFVALTEQSNLPGEIEWNFFKFLFDKDGNLVARYKSADEPMSEKITEKIKELF